MIDGMPERVEVLGGTIALVEFRGSTQIDRLLEIIVTEPMNRGGLIKLDHLRSSLSEIYREVSQWDLAVSEVMDKIEVVRAADAAAADRKFQGDGWSSFRCACSVIARGGGPCPHGVLRARRRKDLPTLDLADERPGQRRERWEAERIRGATFEGAGVRDCQRNLPKIGPTP